MSPERKQAREKLLSIKTRADLETYLDSLNLTDEEREISILIFGRGWTHTQIEMKLGYTKNQIRKRLAKVYDRML